MQIIRAEDTIPAPEIPYQGPSPTEPTQPPESGGSGCKWLVLGAGGCGVLLLVILLAPLLLGLTSVNNMLGGIGTIFNAPPPRASINTSQTLVQGIQPLGQLVSVSAQLAKADISVGIQQGVLNTCGFSANHVAQGAVEAGINLTGITEDDVRYDEASNTYFVTVPAPQVTSCRVDYIRQYDRSATACNVDWDEARLLASYTALIDFRDDAIEGGLLNRAETETRLVLGNFIGTVTGSNVQIIFDETTQPLPPSCQPPSPTGWFIDPATGGWTR